MLSQKSISRKNRLNVIGIHTVLEIDDTDIKAEFLQIARDNVITEVYIEGHLQRSSQPINVSTTVYSGTALHHSTYSKVR